MTAASPYLKPEVIVFDLGKVLLDFDYGIAAARLAAGAARWGVLPHGHQALPSIAAADMQAQIDQSPLLYAFETGQLSSEQFYREVCVRTGFSGSIDDFSGAFSDIFSPIDSIIDLHSRLCKRGLPTFIFSNTNPIAIAHIRQRFPFFERFDGYILSFEHGAMKPEAAIYACAEEIIGKKGPQILYIDDRAENIAAGRDRGWQAMHHVTPEETVATFERLELV